METAAVRPVAGVDKFPTVIATFNQCPQLASVGPHAVNGGVPMPCRTTAGKNDTGVISGNLDIADKFTDTHSKALFEYRNFSLFLEAEQIFPVSAVGEEVRSQRVSLLSLSIWIHLPPAGESPGLRSWADNKLKKKTDTKMTGIKRLCFDMS